MSPGPRACVIKEPCPGVPNPGECTSFAGRSADGLPKTHPDLGDEPVDGLPNPHGPPRPAVTIM